jgi:hypothetical protein
MSDRTGLETEQLYKTSEGSERRKKLKEVRIERHLVRFSKVIDKASLGGKPLNWS